MSAIEWTEKTWNPIAGCSKVSAGCANCYAEKMAGRLEAMAQEKYRGLTVLQGSHRVWAGKIAFDEEALLTPLRRQKPTTYFVNSMSDLFHENVTDEQIDRVFAAMALCPQHTFQVLTKRPERMLRYLADHRVNQGRNTRENMVKGRMWEMLGNVARKKSPAPMRDTWPLRNVWLGVSVENQKTADERIPLLLQTPAAVRFISAEPLLEAVDLSSWMWPMHWHWDSRYNSPEEAIAAGAYAERKPQALVSAQAIFLNWVIVGGESGSGGRPFNIEWARSIVKQCAAAGVSVFVKQMGARVVGDPLGFSSEDSGGPLLKNRKGGDPSEWPEDLRVRQMPEVRA